MTGALNKYIPSDNFHGVNEEFCTTCAFIVQKESALYVAD